MYNDKQLVRITMFVLLVGIVLVYAVFFNTKWDAIAQGAKAALQALSSNESLQKWLGDEEANTLFSGENTAVTGTTSPTGGNATIPENTGTVVVFSGLDKLFGDETDYLGTGVTILSGTTLFQGNIDVLRTLGVNYQYALKDDTYTNLYYVYIGSEKNYDFKDIAQEFGWKTIEVYSQKDIINNLYFGDRVTFIELPQYKDVKVNVFIQLGTDLWMIQDDASQYKAHKKYIRKLFTGK